MSISLVWQLNGADITLDSGLLSDDSVTTDVIASLFTDRRAHAADELPTGKGSDRRGWWGDSYRDQPIGSRLWLLSREKQMQTVLQRAQTYANEALTWMVKAKRINNFTVRASNPAAGVLLLTVTILLNNGAVLPLPFETSLNGV